MSEARGDVDLVGHNVIFLPEQNVGPLPLIDNIVIRTEKPEYKWLEEATMSIGEWRAKLRSTYIRWALAHNALEVAAKRYGDPQWYRTNKFFVTSLRSLGDGKRDEHGRVEADLKKIAEWDGQTAAQAHLKTMPMLAAFGVIDMYSNLEEFVFSLCRLYLNQHPDWIIEDKEFAELRKLRRQAETDEAKKPEWEAAWKTRLDGWHRNAVYKGLAKVFKAFCGRAGLKTPSVYKVSTVETWAETIGAISLVRNALVHGASEVSAELGACSDKVHTSMFGFKKGDPLAVRLYHLQAVDLFCEQLLTALNLSMVELIGRAEKE